MASAQLSDCWLVSYTHDTGAGATLRPQLVWGLYVHGHQAVSFSHLAEILGICRVTKHMAQDITQVVLGGTKGP